MRGRAPIFTRWPKGYVSVTPLTVDLTNHARSSRVCAAGLDRERVNERRLAGIGMTSARTRDRLMHRLREQGIANLTVLDRIRNVPRHIFVDEALASRAYEDTALPIGFSQTISQPYIVARMTEALIEGGRKVGKVLEVGTGCGYQTAVLAPLVRKIYSIERIAPLAKRAKAHAQGTRHQERDAQAWRWHHRLEVAEAVRRHHLVAPRRSRYPKRCLPSSPTRDASSFRWAGGRAAAHPVHAARRAHRTRGVRFRGLRADARRHRPDELRCATVFE